MADAVDIFTHITHPDKRASTIIVLQFRVSLVHIQSHRTPALT